MLAICLVVLCVPVDDLGHEDWKRRERAEWCLRLTWPIRLAELGRAAQSSEPEVRLRADRVLALHRHRERTDRALRWLDGRYEPSMYEAFNDYYLRLYSYHILKARGFHDYYISKIHPSHNPAGSPWTPYWSELRIDLLVVRSYVKQGVVPTGSPYPHYGPHGP